MEEMLFTVKEASKVLKVDQQTVRNLIGKGFIAGLKLGRLKVRKVEIERFLSWAEGKDLSNLDNVIELNNLNNEVDE
ncbi:MAG: helix-turn-helix domain-containing protein [Clostridium sp.]